MPIINPTPIKGPATVHEVVAVEGRVSSWSTQIPKDQLKNRELYRTNTLNGQFKLMLPANIVATVLIKTAKGYYLNSFDGHGNYTSILTKTKMERILIIDDRNSIH